MTRKIVVAEQEIYPHLSYLTLSGLHEEDEEEGQACQTRTTPCEFSNIGAPLLFPILASAD